jgi:hypothetical protein
MAPAVAAGWQSLWQRTDSRSRGSGYESRPEAVLTEVFMVFLSFSGEFRDSPWPLQHAYCLMCWIRDTAQRRKYNLITESNWVAIEWKSEALGLELIWWVVINWISTDTGDFTVYKRVKHGWVKLNLCLSTASCKVLEELQVKFNTFLMSVHSGFRYWWMVSFLL